MISDSSPFTDEDSPENNFEMMECLEGSSDPWNSPRLLDSEDDLPCEFGCGLVLECCQIFRVAPCLLLWLCCSSFTQGLLVNGFVNSVITSLERRYNLKSMDTGFIASMYDVGCLISLLPVSYIGGQGRKSRWLSVGMFLMGIGSLIFLIPHFSVGTYNPQTKADPVCTTFKNTSHCEINEIDHEGLNNFKWVFFLGQLFHGVGAAPLYTLGVTYLDENLVKKKSALYIGIFTTMSLLGPAAGFILGGMFLRIHVDVFTDSKATVNDSEVWVGAWWIGFLLSSIFAFMSAIPLFGFPNTLPGAKKLLDDKEIEINEFDRNTQTFLEAKSETKFDRNIDLGNNISSVGQSLRTSITSFTEEPPSPILNRKQFLPSLKHVLKNGVFVLISLASACEAFNIGACATFIAKYLETEFSITSDWAPIILGLCTIPAGGLGIFLGGLVIRVTDMPLNRILLLQMVTSIVCLPFVLTFAVDCGDTGPTGINSYNTSGFSSDMSNLTLSCNSNCHCSDNYQDFYPVCGADNVNYFSACFAGCLSKNETNYLDCSCVNRNLNSLPANVAMGICPKNCSKKPLFLVMFCLYMFCTFFMSTPMLTSSLRCVHPELRSFAMGIQWIIIRILGSIPGPLFIGILIDMACNVWQTTCSGKGNCAFYDNEILSKMFLFSGLCIKLISCSCLTIAFILSRRKLKKKISKKNSCNEPKPTFL